MKNPQQNPKRAITVETKDVPDNVVHQDSRGESLSFIHIRILLA